MIERYATGLNGFIGTRLKQKIDGIVGIPHEQISTVRLKNFNYFYYLSSYGNLADQKDINETIQANLTDPIDIVCRTQEINYKSFVFFSTSSVNLEIQTPYSRAKKAAEQVMLSFIESQNKPICIIRPYSVTGVGEQEKHLIPTLIRSCLRGTPVNLVKEPVHDFIDVEDVVNGVINLSDHGVKGIFELGTGKKHSNQEVLEIVEDVTKKKANVTYVESMRKYDSENWVCTNYRARGWGWMPRKSLETSITEMVNHYKSNE